VVRVKNLVRDEVWKTRYETIRNFEHLLGCEGTTLVKVMLHISPDEQRKRLQERIDQADKRWKFRLGDLDDRKRWPEFQEAYEDALARTSTDGAPWCCVPADRKWYRNWAVLSILVGVLEHLDPQYPAFPEYDGIVVE
jgi:polyphosphate kinase 2 (PPK2 family)